MKFLRAARIVSAFLLVLNISGCSGLINNNSQNEIKTFTSYIAINGSETDPGNDIQELIAEKTGARCIMTWKNPEKSAEEKIQEMIISGKYPDFIYGGIGQQDLIDADALVPLDEYWDDYENIKSFYTDKEWDKLRKDSGHIYYIPSYDNVYMEDTSTSHSEEAFWIQVKVLEWAGFPEIVTLDQYFDLIERYLKANPLGANGELNIGYEILTDGYMYFCLENPPQFLDGYPNDGCCIVDKNTQTALDYSTTPTAERWFKKLNEEYRKGIIDPGFSFLTTEQYYDKLRTGNVLGMVDQYWNFQSIDAALPSDNQYVPLDLVIDEGIEPHYRSARTIDVSQGLGISVCCDDVESALKFMNDLLDPEILNLRFWGVEGKDYMVGSDGVFYRTEEQRNQQNDEKYMAEHFCRYDCFPFYLGMNQDGINAYSAENQVSEYYSGLSGVMKRCLDAYGVQTIAELINPTEQNEAWYPMWTYTNNFTSSTTYGKAKEDMDYIKHKYLPQVVMSDDFSSSWKEFLNIYNSECDTRSYFNELTSEVRRRAGS